MTDSTAPRGPCAVCASHGDLVPLVCDRRVMVCRECDRAWRDWIDTHSGRRDPDIRRRRYEPRA
jgi:hypothetical protein